MIKFEHDQIVQLDGEGANQFKFNENSIQTLHTILYKLEGYLELFNPLPIYLHFHNPYTTF